MSIQSIAFTLTFLLSSVSFAVEITVQCGADGTLLSQKTDTDNLDLSVQAHIERAIEFVDQHNRHSGCPGNSNIQGETLALISESNSRSRIWSTKPGYNETWFDKEIIRRIIKAALDGGVDPYVALAISIDENAPYKSKQHESDPTYGQIGGSLTGRAIANSFGCNLVSQPDQLGANLRVTPEEILQYKGYFKNSHPNLEMSKNSDNQFGGVGSAATNSPLPAELEKLKETDPEKFDQLSCFANSACKGLLRNGHTVAIDLSAGLLTNLSSSNSRTTVVKNLCFGNELDRPSYPQITTSPANSNRCCSQVRMEKDLASSQDSVNSTLVSHFFFQIIKNQIQAAKAPSNLSAAEKLAWLLQGYNGRGKFPSWGNSKCLVGLNMGDTPVYGATIADIMTNMLMTNPEVSEMIDEERKQSHLPQRSLICGATGTGTQKIESQELADLEKKYLSGDRTVPERFNICSKGHPPMTYQPWSTDEADIFLGK